MSFGSRFTGITFLFLIAIECHSARAQISNHRIYYRNDKRAPLTSLKIVFRGAGYQQGSQEKVGLARTTARMLLKSGRSSGLVEELELLGTDLWMDVGEVSFTISLSMLSGNFEKSIEITNRLVQEAHFSLQNLKEVKRKLEIEYHNALRSRAYGMMRRFALFGKSRIGKIRSLSTLKNITLDDVKEYHKNLLETEVVFFKVISNLDSSTVCNYLNPIMQSRQTGGFKFLKEDIAKNRLSGAKAYLFEYPRINIDYSYWIIPCGSVGDGSAIPELVADTIGGDAYGMLHRRFREELGLCYSAFCQLITLGGNRFIEIYANPPTDKSEELIQGMLDFIRTLNTNQEFWESLEERKQIYRNAFVHSLSPGQSLEDEVKRDLYGVSAVDKIAIIDEIDREQVDLLLRKYFVSENLIMIFQGEKERITGILNRHMSEASIQTHYVDELID